MSVTFYDSRAWLELRYEVIRKSDGRCSCCGVKPTKDNPIHVDHVKPRSKFPELALVESNLQVLCRACNLGKSNVDDTRWDKIEIIDPIGLAAIALPRDDRARFWDARRRMQSRDGAIRETARAECEEWSRRISEVARPKVTA